ncbi:hypothetical protein G647_02961 [Cladophialophora carrionii CBS 160.54]|uniref:C3H1-type domain-containing protein n=1 Tax=Cladophialophora carrionii CBS 160.54 TaxID=1279043 RepID=V9DH09_9EURO|nr:uncharacterized protein G647_02961 [Cladophialophora carrionii CBS 160.54]ETI26184.1 hypothetical protein G647_02961 [Cladophialophora carrionii CBS 160.54]
MSSQPFSFPPPPPPPPKRTTDRAFPQNQGYQNGRGSFRGGHASRATTRGGRGGHANHRAGGHGNFMNHGQNWSNPSRPLHNGSSRGGQFHGQQKRDYNTAFAPTQQQQQHRPRPTAPPAVPNFNAPIQHLLARQPSIEQPNQTPPDPQRPEQKKQNLLGLTPAKFEQDSDPEDDEDEERRLADQTTPASTGYVFEYNGSPLLLRSREEILAWIAERKRRYPTEAKREAARKEADLKKRKREEEYQARLEARKEAQLKREQERAERQRAKEQERTERQKAKDSDNKRRIKDEASLDEASRARLKAEKLRKRALKAQRDLEKAEEALRLVQSQKDEEALPVPIDDIPSQGPSLNPLDAPTTPVAIRGEDETSSSGSSTIDSDSDSDSDSDDTSPDSDSDSDADSAPEVTSTKQPHRTRDSLALTPVAQRAKAKAPRLCQHFVKYKTCRYASNCRYSHDLSQKGRRAAGGTLDVAKSDRGLSSNVSGPSRRKGLWEVMVEKEQEEERKRVLEAIITLGQRGLLEDPSQGAGPDPKPEPDGSR